MQIPTTWKLHDVRCGTPIRDTWTVPTGELDCRLSPTPDVTSVRFNELRGDLRQPKGWTVSHITLPGSSPVAAIRTEAPDGTAPYVVWISVPSLSASVTFTAHQQSTVETLVKSVTVVDRAAMGAPLRRTT